MLIDCPICRARVNGDVLQVAEYDAIPWDAYRVVLLRCPECTHLLAGEQTPEALDKQGKVLFWKNPSRVWPEPLSDLAETIPVTIRAGLIEARKCFHAGAYTACVAMSGRAIEAMCRHFSTQKETLFEGLKELNERQIIDARLYEWSDELRRHRNLAAHASNVQFSWHDAKDLYEFASAICDYVFVLTAKFEAFKERQSKAEAARVP